MGKTPFDILGEPVNRTSDMGRFMNSLGMQPLAFTLEAIGMICAVVVILLSMLMLLVVNYPKTVAQTKQKIAQAILTVIFIAILPLFMDVIYNTCLMAFYGV